MRVRLKWNEGQNPELLFRSIPEKSIWASFSSSMFVQAAVVWLGVSYLHFLAMLPPDSIFEVRRDRVLDLSSEETDRSITAPNLAEMQPAPSTASPSGRSQTARAAAPSPSPLATLPAPSLAAREFRMPPVRSKRPVPQTLVQMDLPPTLDLHQQLRVPRIVMLASTARRVAKPFVAPPHRKNTMEVPSQVALEMRPPILDVKPGFAKTPDLLRDTTPRLPAPVGAVTPVASNREPVETRPAAATVTGNVSDEPSNIISLPDRPIPAASAIVLPPLNQVSGKDSASGVAGPLDPTGGQAVIGKAGPGESPGTPPGTQTNGGRGPETAPHGGTGGLLAKNTGGGISPGSRAPGIGAGAAASGAPGVGGKSGPEGPGAAGSGTRTGAGSSGGNGTGAAGRSGPVRLIRPQNGSYEVAIVQSSGVVPGSNGMLKGKPVYSVYIPVGTGKEWILQYCLPADDAHAAPRSQVVQLGAITPIGAPYAFTIVGPAIQFRAGARYAFIHGFVNVSGRFEHLEESSDQEIENIGAVLESLGQWEFRPATKDGVPAVVEILLCIPNAA